MFARARRSAILKFWKWPLNEVSAGLTAASGSGKHSGEDGASSSNVKEIQVREESSKTNVPAVTEHHLSPPASPNYLGYLSGVLSSLWKSEKPQEKDVKKKRPTPVRVIAKRYSLSEVANRAQGMVSRLMVAESTESIRLRTSELCAHFVEFPATRVIAVKNKRFMSTLLKFVSNSKDDELKGDIRQCLSVLGSVETPKGAGVRVLSIDGGGTRGMMGLEVLQALEDALNGPKIADMFDLIVGVSTGAIIASLLAAKEYSVKRSKDTYIEMSRDLFNQGRFSGVSGLIMSHSYYNTNKWVDILKKMAGEDELMLDSSRRQRAPRLGIVSCVVNTASLQPYVFRNYAHPPGRDSHIRGGCDHKLWEALQASAAAPGYFEEVALGAVLHQDGGVLANNPTALALHEARMLWPNEKIQCVVSVGNGHHVNDIDIGDTELSTGVQQKILRIVDSATDTELVHLCMHDLLPANTYFRLSPYMSFPYTLDEIDPEKLSQMENDARLYVRRNRAKIEATAESLLMQPSTILMATRAIRNMAQRAGLYMQTF